MFGYKPTVVKKGKKTVRVFVQKKMVCRCRRCKTTLRTRWPETWQTHGWWIVIKKGKEKLYCRSCKKKEVRRGSKNNGRSDKNNRRKGAHRG